MFLAPAATSLMLIPICSAFPMTTKTKSHNANNAEGRGDGASPHNHCIQ